VQQVKAVLVRVTDNLPAAVQAELRDYGATVDASFPDVDSAVSHYHGPTTERRLFVTEVRGLEDIPGLGRLADAFPGNPIIVISPAGDAATLLAELRAGATQIVPAPMKPVEFRDALDRVTRQFDLRPSAGRVIAVSGVTEGCGGTTLALNIAAEARRLGAEQAVLIELGGRVGRLAVMLNITPRYTTADLLGDMNAVDMAGLRKAVTPVQDGLLVLPGPYQAIAPAAPSLAAVHRLLTMARRLANVVVLDMTCSFDETYFGTLKTVDDVVLVADQKVPSVHSLMLVRDALVSQGVHARQYYAINRYSADMPGATLSEIGTLMPDAKLYPIRTDGRGVMEAINLGKPLREVAPDSPVLHDLGRLLEGVAGGAISGPVAPHRDGWLRRSLGKLFAP
jgi:pilus assembly protein CpaE